MPDEVAEQFQLGGDFRAADNRRDRAGGIVERRADRLQFCLHGASGIGRQLVCDALGRGMGAMGGREGVVDINVAELCQLRHEGRIVLFLALVEACVLQQQDIAVLHRGDGIRCGFADTVGCESHWLLQMFGEHLRQRCEGVLLVRAILGAAEMCEQDDLAAAICNVDDGRQDAIDTRCIGDATVFHRHVQIDAHEDAFACDVCFIECAK